MLRSVIGLIASSFKKRDVYCVPSVRLHPRGGEKGLTRGRCQPVMCQRARLVDVFWPAQKVRSTKLPCRESNRANPMCQ